MKLLSLLLFLLITASASFTGKVVKITDGDTIVVLTEDKEQVKIRLEGIDCPESTQDFGNRAKQATSDLCFGKQVKIIKSGEDRYGRTLGVLYIDGQDINLLSIKSGYAWHFKRYSSDQDYASTEGYAKKNKLGLWILSNPIPPWDWRGK